MKKIIGILITVVLVFPASALALESAKELSAKALKDCQQGRNANASAVRLAFFEQAQALAERALDLDDQLAEGHFALFCGLGEQIRLDGESLSSLFGLSRILSALDRTLRLDPNHLDALSAKATFLVKLPRLLGGDLEKGEQLLRRVIREDPTSIHARVTLAQIHADRGEYVEAMVLTTLALKHAQDQQWQDLIPDARHLLADLRMAARL